MTETTSVQKLVKPSHPAHGDLLNIVTAVAATAIAHRANQPTDFKPGEFVGFACRVATKRVRFPLHGPVELLIAENKPPVDICLTIDDTVEPFNAGMQIEGIGAFFDRLVFPFLGNFFERERARMERRFTKTRTSWPDSWPMAWALRNATAHGGRAFDLPTRQPVTWRGLTFGPADEPAKSLVTLLNGADAMLLIFDMADDLP